MSNSMNTIIIGIREFLITEYIINSYWQEPWPNIIRCVIITINFLLNLAADWPVLPGCDAPSELMLQC